MKQITEKEIEDLGFGVAMSCREYSQWSDDAVSIILQLEGGVINRLGLVTGRDEKLNMPIVVFYSVHIDTIASLRLLVGRLKNEEK